MYMVWGHPKGFPYYPQPPMTPHAPTTPHGPRAQQPLPPLEPLSPPAPPPPPAQTPRGHLLHRSARWVLTAHATEQEQSAAMDPEGQPRQAHGPQAGSGMRQGPQWETAGTETGNPHYPAGPVCSCGVNDGAGLACAVP